MSFNKSYGTLKTANLSLTNGAPSGALIAAPVADENVYIFDLLITTNDTAIPLITLTNTTGGATLAKFYVNSSAPTLDASSTPIKALLGSGVTVAASAVTAAKTVEVKCVYLVSKT